MKKIKSKLKDQIVKAKQSDATLQEAFESAMTLAEWGFKCEQTLQECKDISDQVFLHKFDLVKSLNEIEYLRTQFSTIEVTIISLSNIIKGMDKAIQKLEQKKWYQFWR